MHTAHLADRRTVNARRQAAARAKAADTSLTIAVWSALWATLLGALCWLAFAATAVAAGGTAHDTSATVTQGAGPVEPLAVLETALPVPFSCGQAECVAVLSTIALDEHNPAATPGKPFALADRAGSAIRIGGDGAAGGVALADIDRARLEAGDHYATVRLILPRSSLADLELGPSASVTVAHNTPIVAGTAAGQGAGRGVDFTTPMTVLALKQADARAETIAGQLIGLSLAGQADAPLDGNRVRANWQSVKGQAKELGVPVRAVAMANAAFSRCHRTSQAGTLPLDACLWSHHNGFLAVLNRAYWRAAVPGA